MQLTPDLVRRSLVVLTLATCILSSCAIITGGSHVEPGLIIFYRDTATITAPDTVLANARFEVRLRTFAGGCTREIARTDVTVRNQFVEIRPYNRNSGDDICTADLITLEHRAEVRIPAVGSTVIRVIGEQRGGSSGSRNAPAQLEKGIVVR